MFRLYKAEREIMARPITEEDLKNVTRCGDIKIGNVFAGVPWHNRKPQLGDMIAHHPYNDKLMWVISARDFEKYSLVQ